jgi:hypothetical protein
MDMSKIKLLLQLYGQGSGDGNPNPMHYADPPMGMQDILKKLLGRSTATPQAPAWATRAPTSTPELLRQLSGNVGQMTMPGGPVGAVMQPAFGSGRPATQQMIPARYGRQPGYGEATFFGQSMTGGMTPLSAITPLGRPKGWNPYQSPQGGKKDDKMHDGIPGNAHQNGRK